MENNKKTKTQLLEQIKNLEKQNTELKCTVTSLKDRAAHMSERNNQLWHEKMFLQDWIYRILTFYHLKTSDLEEMLEREKDRNLAYEFLDNNIGELLGNLETKPEVSD